MDVEGRREVHLWVWCNSHGSRLQGPVDGCPLDLHLQPSLNMEPAFGPEGNSYNREESG